MNHTNALTFWHVPQHEEVEKRPFLNSHKWQSLISSVTGFFWFVPQWEMCNNVLRKLSWETAILQWTCDLRLTLQRSVVTYRTVLVDHPSKLSEKLKLDWCDGILNKVKLCNIQK